MNKKFLKNPFLISLLFNIALLSIFIFSGTMKFEVSDDFIMETIVSGSYNGTPEPYIMFMSPILGYLLSGLYTFVPFINWYVWFQVLLICLGFTIIDAYILKKNFCFKWVLICIFTFFFSADLYQLMQFTKTATFSLISAVFLFFMYMEEGNLKFLVESLILFTFGLWIRYMTFFIVVPVLFIFSIYFIYRNKDQFKLLIKREIIFIFCGIFLFISTIGIQYLYTSIDKPYQKYTSFGEVRAELVDYQYIPYNLIQESLNDIGISETEYEMIFHWNYGDHDFFTVDKMKQVLDIVRDFRNTHPISKKESIKTLFFKGYWTYVSVWGCILLFLWVLVKNPKSIFILLTLSCVAGLLLFFNQIQGRLVYRVEYSIFLALGSSFLLTYQEVARYNFKHVSLLQKLIIMVLVFGKGFSLIPERAEDRYEIMNLSWENDLKKYKLSFSNEKEDFKNYLYENKEKVYIFDFRTMIQSYYLSFGLFDPLQDGDYENSIYFGGVDSYNPSYCEKLENFHFDDLANALLEDHVYYVNNDSSRLMLDYLKKHIDSNVNLAFVAEIDGYKVWKFSV